MDAPTAPPTYRDRRTGLIVFGIVEIIIGCFCLLLMLMMFVGRVGPLTLALALAHRAAMKPKIRYPEGKVLLG